MNLIHKYLKQHGPSRSSSIADWLMSSERLTADAARKRLSRVKEPVLKFPVKLLPKGENFLYLRDQRNEERFWVNFHEAMRSSGSIFGIAIDSLLARHGVVREEDFPIICGAPATAMKKQLMAAHVATRLIRAGVIEKNAYIDGETLISVRRLELGAPDWEGLKGRSLAEKIVLDGLREWVKKHGMASYNRITIRGDVNRKPVHQFMFDLSGPSYLLPLKSSGKQPGFLVADILVDIVMDEFQIEYFIRKATMLNTLLKGTGVLAILVADGFTSKALTMGHAAGLMLATPSSLFGHQVGKALQTLLETLNNAAAYASSSPERLIKLMDDLSEIEGAAGNLRGILFELLAAYLVRRDSVSIDMGIRAYDVKTGKNADIDILKFTSHQAECVSIECKGKVPGGTISLSEVEDWIRRLPIFQAYLRSQNHLRETKLSFELWTSGTFDKDALEYLAEEKKKRIKFPIAWKDGDDVLDLARKGKEKAITDALKQHFFKHPLADVTSSYESIEMKSLEIKKAATSNVPLLGVDT